MSDEKPKKQPAKPTPPKPKKRQIPIEASKDLKTVYSNGVIIANTPTEFVVDFAQILPRSTKGKIESRVILSPTHAKLFLRAMAQNISNYERQYGEIRIPVQSSLADQFFQSPQGDNKDKKDDGND